MAPFNHENSTLSRLSHAPLILSNLGFEYELAAGAEYRPSPLLDKLCQNWSYILRLLPGLEEAECLDSSTPPPHPNSPLVPWGVNSQVLELAKRLNLRQNFPALEVVREVNDKRFSHRLEQKLDIALPHSAIVESLAQLQNLVRSCPHHWVLKHPFGVSGRERVLGKAGVLPASSSAWAQSQFDKDWSLVFEPWVNRTAEYSLHFEIEQSAKICYLGQCDLVTDSGGVYRGNRVIPGTTDQEVPDKVEKVVEELARNGYWGPLSIDAFCGKLGSQDILRPLVEINARYSFGRLTLAWASRLPPGWSYFWWHPKGKSLKVSLPELPSKDVRAGAYRLPSLVDPEQISSSLLVLAPTSSELAFEVEKVRVCLEGR